MSDFKCTDQAVLLEQDVKSWSLADKDAIKGVEPLEDALPCRFRPEVLGRTFGGQVRRNAGLDIANTSIDLPEFRQNPPDSNLRSAGASMTSLAESSRAAYSFVSLADTKAGGSPLEAAAGGKLHKIVNKSLKYSHPREGRRRVWSRSKKGRIKSLVFRSRNRQLDFGSTHDDSSVQLYHSGGQFVDGHTKSWALHQSSHAVLTPGWEQDQ